MAPGVKELDIMVIMVIMAIMVNMVIMVMATMSRAMVTTTTKLLDTGMEGKTIVIACPSNSVLRSALLAIWASQSKTTHP